MPQNIDGKSTLVMVWCRQVRSHYLKQCRRSSATPDISRADRNRCDRQRTVWIASWVKSCISPRNHSESASEKGRFRHRLLKPCLHNLSDKFLAATKQLYKWYFPSVCLSVCPSVRLSVTPFSHHRIIMKFSGVITMVKSDVHAKGQGQRSKVKVTEVNTQLSRFRTLTLVWIHIWQWNHAHSWKQHRRGALLFFKVIRQISRSLGSKNRRIWPRLGVSGL